MTYPLREDYGDRGEVVQGEDYEIAYSNNIKCGKGVMRAVSLRDGIYSSEDGYFYIVPAKGSVSKLGIGKKQIKVTVKDQKESGLTGYQISYRAKGTKKWKNVSSTKNVMTVKKLKKGKTYQFRVRGYVNIDGTKYYGKWSKIKTSKKVK